MTDTKIRREHETNHALPRSAFVGAFAIAPNGAFGVAFQITNRSQFDVVQGALQRCNSRANGACRLYALDNRVVWTEP